MQPSADMGSADATRAMNASAHEGRIAVELDASQWLVHPVTDDDDRVTDYLLVARTAGAERIVARVPYRAYADWLLARVAGSDECAAAGRHVCGGNDDAAQ